ncbi:carbon monoxide dehydrogenase [Pseudolabrys sp. Root1462]|uniref:xanthine dehydrogenase family protein molybdopterin-binding subunit n=1 Tax=Pseudolabrys sp. Root1462 TaxID=1736466 RepID=UPI000703A262|nr:xanthine dehydrogenase family protein molybdopterin-binding subunit [Pseudolabrys sp. Root1462]KQZ01357.1 carbon monoxide dehydrogenase [Pseudolabrys sp. Root1462]
MDDRTTETALSLTKFGIGQPVTRKEDPILVQGHGRYNDDISLPKQAYAWMVRSSEPHGIIRGIDTEAAKAMPGVLAVLTGQDLKDYNGLKCFLPIKSRDGSPIKFNPRPALATDKVRFVGDPVACVIAESVAQAKDAAEAVALDIEPLPAVVSARDAAKPGAPLLYDDIPNNIALDYQHGDPDKVGAALKNAAHVVRLPLINQRLMVAPMEPRSAIGEYDAKNDHWTLHSSSQGVFGMKNLLKDILKAPAEKVRVLTGNVGGSFGMKATPYPEYVCILHASKMLGRPVKWTDDRSGSFVSDHQGRDYDMTVEVGFGKDGVIQAVRLTGYGNLGAWCANFGPLLPTLNVTKNIISMYRTPLLEVSTKCVYSNTTIVSAYRGAGRPEGALSIERCMDIAAIELGIDRFELRRRNFIKPKEMPFETPAGTTYDCGDFSGLFKQALDVADVKGFAARKRASKKAGKLRGLGVACYVETTAAMTQEMGGIRFNADGTVTIVTGTLDYGQGHASAFAQVLSAKLGVPFDKIKLMQGDSDQLVTGGGSGGSRSGMLSGTAVSEASDKVIENGKQIAAHALEASAGDIEFATGTFRVAGTDHSIGIMQLAERLRSGSIKLPEGAPTTLDVTHVTEPVPGTYPNGVHVVEVEIESDTGLTRVVKYNAVNDFGTVLNPLLVEGQVQGGIVQGLGQVLLEGVVYDDAGQLVTGSFMDYAMPRAHDAPMIKVDNRPVPTKTNPLGAKGCGEAGTSGGLPAVANAVIDALAEFGIKHLEMPMTSSKIWEALENAKAAKPAA